jgi:hypothetical protein
LNPLMKNAAIVLVMVMMALPALAQQVTPEVKKPYRKLAAIVGYHWSGTNMTEAGVAWGHRCTYTDNCNLIANRFIYDYFSLSAEFETNSSNPLVAAKAGYHFVLGVPSVGVSTLWYTDGTNSEFVLRPEVGLSAFGIATVSYGYNLQARQSIERITVNQVSLKFILGTRLFK